MMLKIKQHLKEYVENDGVVINEGFEEAMAKIEEENGVSYQYSGEEKEIVKKIKDLIDTHVKPAVEMDGGAIQFISFEDGKVSLLLQGSCSGCPSSTVTLKQGIEGMMKRMIPEVEEVVAVAG